MAETLDTIFNPNADNDIYGVSRQPDRRTIIVGYFEHISTYVKSKIARINVNGSLDTAFPDGDYFPGIALYQTITQLDGKILVCGANITGLSVHCLRRINANNTLDTSFAPNPNGDVGCIYLQADNKIMVGGWFTSIGGVTRNGMARLNSDGTVDTTFINCVFNSSVSSIQQLSDGKYLVGGDFNVINGVVRTKLAVINADGTLYTGFVYNCGGVGASTVNTVYRCADNKFLVAGYFDTIGGVTRNRIARFNADYTIDNTLNLTFTGSYVDGVVQRSNGDIYIGGSFSVINGVGRSNIAVINNDGTLSSTFNIVVNGAITDIIADNEDVTFVGYFTSALAQVRNHGARLASAFLPTGWCGAGSPWTNTNSPWCGAGVAWSGVDASISPITDFGTFIDPHGIAIDNNYIYVADSGNHKIQVFNKTTYALISQFGSYGTSDGQFRSPLGIAVDANYIYVADSNNNRVQVFDIVTYAFIGKFGSYGSGNGQFGYIVNIAVDANYIYILESGYLNGRGQVFNKTTYAFVSIFGAAGTGIGLFYGNSYGLAIDNNYIYAANYSGSKVLLFSKSTYAFILEFNCALAPSSITVDSNYIYVYGASANILQVYHISTHNLLFTLPAVFTVYGLVCVFPLIYMTSYYIDKVRVYNLFFPTGWCGAGTPWGA